MKFVIFDTETTALPAKFRKPGTVDTVNGKPYNARGEVIQLSAAVCNEDINIERFISFYCKPTEPITDGAFDVHNISNESISKLSKGKYLEDYLLNDYKDIFLSKGNVFVGHNVMFDTTIVRDNLASYSIDCIDFGNPITGLDRLSESKNYNLCTMKTFKSTFGLRKWPRLEECIEMLGYSSVLPNLAEKVLSKFNMNLSSDFHNADYDVIATWIVLNKLRQSL